MGIVFQNPDFSLFNLTVEEEVEFGLKNFKLNDISSRVNTALELVGLQHQKKTNPQDLSMSQKQKLALACVLALETDYTLLDEPSFMLDYKIAMEIYKFLWKLNQKGKIIIVIGHDTNFLWQFCDLSLILSEGKVILFDQTKRVFEKIKLSKN